MMRVARCALDNAYGYMKSSDGEMKDETPKITPPVVL